MKYLKISALIAGLSIATVSVPQVQALVSTDFLNQKNQITSNSLQKEAHAKPYLLSSINTLSSSNLKAEAVPQNNKLQFVQNTQSEAQPEVIKEQKGKLKIVNDTPFFALVQLYQPNSEQPDRYINVPPCHERSLFETYSNLWKVQFNAQKKTPIYEVSHKERNTFLVITSQLNKDTNRTCSYKLTSQDVNVPPPDELFKGLVNAASEIQFLLSKSGSIGEEPSKLGRILIKAWLNITNSLSEGAVIAADNQEIKHLLLNVSPINLDKLNIELAKYNPNHKQILDLNTYKAISNRAKMYFNELEPKYFASLDPSTLPQYQKQIRLLTETQSGTSEIIHVSTKGTSIFDIITKSSISKSGVFRASSKIDFSKKSYAYSGYLSKPELKVYNLATSIN